MHSMGLKDKMFLVYIQNRLDAAKKKKRRAERRREKGRAESEEDKRSRKRLIRI